MSDFLSPVFTKKPTQIGIKVWVISESKTGYVLDFEVYTGAKKESSTVGLDYQVVMSLSICGLTFIHRLGC